MEKWRGKLAVVTGASAGIGQSILESFAENGINVIGLARRSEKVEQIAEELGDVPGKIYSRKCDISDLRSLKETFNWIEEKFGTISILVNNAAIGLGIKILDGDDDTTESVVKTIDTNFKGTVHCTREAVRLMKKSGDHGIVININDICGHYIPFLEEESTNVYAPTKFALTAFSDVLRHELIMEANDKIKVSCINPGTVRSEDPVEGEFFSDENYFDNNPHLQPEDIASGALFLLQTPFNVNITQLTIRPVGEKL